jgi:hypothetical protein
MALWLAIQVIQIGIFDHFDQAYWLFSFTKKIQSFGRLRNVNAKGNASRVATMFGPVPNTFQYVYKWCSPNTWCSDDTCLYATDCKDGFVVRKLQRGLSSMETWCERWNIKINEDKSRGIYFSLSRRPPESHFTLNGRDIPFVNSVKYLGVIFDKIVTWRLHIEMIEAKACRTFIWIYSLFKTERLNTNFKLLNSERQESS